MTSLTTTMSLFAAVNGLQMVVESIGKNRYRAYYKEFGTILVGEGDSHIENAIEDYRKKIVGHPIKTTDDKLIHVPRLVL